MFLPAKRAACDIECIYRRLDDPVPTAVMDEADRAGRSVMVTIEPFDGMHNGDIRRWGRGLRGRVCLVRFGHEPNLAPEHAYPWGNRPSAYVAGFRRLSEMLTDCLTVWSPNVEYPGSRPLDDYWPGSGYVDVVALDGYAWQGTEVPDALFGPTLAVVRDLTAAPAMIGETACPRGPRQARYVRDLWSFAESEGMLAVGWFNIDKERQWSLDEHGLLAWNDAARGKRRG